MGAMAFMMVTCDETWPSALPNANLGERNRAGWRTCRRAGGAEAPHARPAHNGCSHAADTKKPLVTAVVSACE